MDKETENQKYRKLVKENILKAIELHKRDIKKLKATLKRMESRHPYYEQSKSNQTRIHLL